MLKVGPERILYCVTDSIAFLKNCKDKRLYTSRGLGNWPDEMDGDNVIEEIIELALKSYMLVTKNKPRESMKAI